MHMQWLNTETSILHSPELIGSDPVARATWFCISLWCATQENGGRISGAKKWKDRQWQQTCGVTLSEVTHETQLLEWEGEDLLVWNYPVEKERVVATKRQQGKQGANSRWNRSANGEPNGEPNASANTERKGKERKGKESCENDDSLGLADPRIIPEPKPLMPHVVALATACRLERESMGSNEYSCAAKIKNRAISKYPTDAEIAQQIIVRAERYKKKYPDAPLTPNALEKHWTEFGEEFLEKAKSYT